MVLADRGLELTVGCLTRLAGQSQSQRDAIPGGATLDVHRRGEASSPAIAALVGEAKGQVGHPEFREGREETDVRWNQRTQVGGTTHGCDLSGRHRPGGSTGARREEQPAPARRRGDRDCGDGTVLQAHSDRIPTGEPHDPGGWNRHALAAVGKHP